jgi:hypothetical protein
LKKQGRGGPRCWTTRTIRRHDGPLFIIFRNLEIAVVTCPRYDRYFLKRQARPVVPVNALAVSLWDKTLLRYLGGLRLVSLAMAQDRDDAVDDDFLRIAL